MCSVSVGLSCMSCNGCPRPAIGWCAGCRTVSRIKWIWGNNLGEPEDSVALSILRDCAGSLTDLAETRSGRLSQASGSGGPPEVGRGRSPPVAAAAPASSPGSGRKREEAERSKVAKDKSHKKEGKDRRRREESKDRDRRRRRRKASPSEERREVPPTVLEIAKAKAEPASSGGSLVEESEEEEPREADPPVRSNPTRGDKPTVEHPIRPLGLTPIGATLSAPTPEPLAAEVRRDEGRRGAPETGRETSEDRPELPRRRRSESDRHRLARSPDPPPPRGSQPARKRSRSKQKKSKGVKKRKRNAEFWRRVDQEKQQWRQKQKQRWGPRPRRGWEELVAVRPPWMEEYKKRSSCSTGSGKKGSPQEGSRLLGSRSGVCSSRGSPGGVQGGPDHRSDRRSLLRGEDEVLRKVGKVGYGGGPLPLPPEGPGHYFGTTAESLLLESIGDFHRASLHSRLQTGRDGRSVPARGEGQVGGEPGGRARLDEQPRDSGRARCSPRRSGGSAGEGKGIIRSPSRGQRRPEGACREEQFQLQRKKGKEKEEEGQEEKERVQGKETFKAQGEEEERREARWEAPITGIGQGPRRFVRRNGAKLKRKDQKKGHPSGKKVREEEEGQEQLFGELKHGRKQQPRRGRHTGRCLRGNLPSPGGQRSLSGSVGRAVVEVDADNAPAGDRRRVTDRGGKTRCGGLLSAATGQEAQWASQQGGLDAHDGHGLSSSREGKPSHGLDGTTPEVGGSSRQRHSLAGSSEDGGKLAGCVADSPTCGTSRSSKRILRGLPSLVAGQLASGRKGKGKATRRKRRWQERRWEEGRKGKHQRQRSGRQEGVQVNLGKNNREGPGGELLEEAMKENAEQPSLEGGAISSVSIVRPSVTTTDAGFSTNLLHGIPPSSGKKGVSNDEPRDVSSLNFLDLGSQIMQRFLEVLPLRSQTMGSGGADSVFPFPTSRDVLQGLFPGLCSEELWWLSCICLGLNSLWGESLFCDKAPNSIQSRCLKELLSDVERLKDLQGTVSHFDWSEFFRTRGVDYQGEEVKVALKFSWSNISPALPKEIGRVPLEDVCVQGAKYYVENFDSFIKDSSVWPRIKSPRVMVDDADWDGVCQGLVSSGICTLLTREEVFCVDDEPLLNGLFGVSKDEVKDGVPVFRLIMNLIPLNNICQNLSGDVATLPGWSTMAPYFLQPSENLLVSSEDVRCFFYTMSVPHCWHKYLAFNKKVRDACLPEHLKGREVYLASRVLPMGFLNSVSLAQHVHRHLVLRTSVSSSVQGDINPAQSELRKDRQFPETSEMWRVYLDNYDLLEKVSATDMVGLEGSTSAAVLALREQYEVWDVPRNTKKAVERSSLAEVQGAMVDGTRGLAYPREVKLLKYLSAALKLCTQPKVSQKQLQVVCGGLVYISMFRRPLLGSLNAVWRQIEDFNHTGLFMSPLWGDCKFEILRFLSLLPLSRMDFRVPIHPQVTCSDASTTGGGVCASLGLTVFGAQVSCGGLRGEYGEDQRDHQILSIGLFDGIGALRVALDLLGVNVLGHISVEQNVSAARVVEASFPSVITIDDVRSIDLAMVQLWAGQFSQASLVLLGAGPPCQGVSGLNADRKGALKDERSGLFTHVKRVEDMVKVSFPWCQVHTFMESVASMDRVDQDVMSEDFGSEPWKCDSKTVTWCSRPRLYWLTWELALGPGVELLIDAAIREVVLTALQDLEMVCKPGWIKVDPSRAFPTFTTSRPRDRAGHKPAGLSQCDDEEISRWIKDQHRFPPYQYMNRNLLVSKTGELRLPDAEEREMMMGFPVMYTSNCLPKGKRKGADYTDTRLTLLGNSWSVPVVAWFLSQLLAPRGLCTPHSPQDIITKLTPQPGEPICSLLFRQPLRADRRLQPAGDPIKLAFKLGNLVSIKGEDILLTSSSSEQAKFHRLRASVPSKLWKWKVVSGWKWKNKGDHINVLEMRAVLTTLKWRIAHKQHIRFKMIHLTDSLVCLHSLSRGRSSSRKLRRTLSRINALLLASSSQALWAYVHTDQNPADRPSRWGRGIKTKFKNA